MIYFPNVDLRISAFFPCSQKKRLQSSVESSRTLLSGPSFWFDSLLPLSFEWPSFSSHQLPPWLHFLGLESSSLKAPSLLSDLRSNITSSGCLPYSPWQSSVLDGVVPSTSPSEGVSCMGFDVDLRDLWIICASPQTTSSRRAGPGLVLLWCSTGTSTVPGTGFVRWTHWWRSAEVLWSRTQSTCT